MIITVAILFFVFGWLCADNRKLGRLIEIAKSVNAKAEHEINDERAIGMLEVNSVYLKKL